MQADPFQSRAYLPWLSRLGADIRSLTEEICARAAESPDPKVLPRLGKVRRLVIHHSATREGDVRSFRVLHRLLRDWLDVGYHFVIGNGTFSPDGAVERGRPETARGAHARGANSVSLGICLVGDFTETPPTSTQLDALGALLGELTARYGLGENDILLHRQVKGSRTLCPGAHLPPDKVRNALRASTPCL